MLTTLEKSGLVERSRHSEDGRRVVVRLLDGGLDTIESVFPEFNRYEAKFIATSTTTRDGIWPGSCAESRRPPTGLVSSPSEAVCRYHSFGC